MGNQGLKTLMICLWVVFFGMSAIHSQSVELVVPLGHHGEVSSVALSADGKTVASGSWDQTVKIWHAASGKEIRTLSGHTKMVWSVALSADGRTVVSGSHDGTLKIWDVETGKELQTLAGDGAATTALALSTDGRNCIAGHIDGKIGLWDLSSSIVRFARLHSRVPIARAS